MMNASSSLRTHTVSFTIESICNRFEAAWKADQGPSLEDLLRAASAHERADLFWHLLTLELDYRILRKETPSQAEFVARFPEYVALISEAFDELTENSTSHSDIAISDEPLPRLVPGTRLEERYTVDTFLARGGMGEIYCSTDSRMRRKVAIKVLPARFAHHEALLTRFKREAEVLAQLNHPNIVTVYDVGADFEVPFVAMEMLEGRNLHEEIGGRPMKWDRAVEIAKAVAAGLEAAHSKGIVHRDIKPRNIFITKVGTTKILDFGLAGWLESAAGSIDQRCGIFHTMTSGRLGTASYIPPEQIRGEPVDHRGDIFALGCVLHEMLAGTSPFRRPTEEASDSATLYDEPSLPKVISKGMPAGLSRVIDRCLAKDPAKRIQSASELTAALRSIDRPTRLPIWPALVAVAIMFVLITLLLLPRPYVPRQEAVRYYHEGMQQLTWESEAQIMNAIDKFKAAIDSDPRYAQAHCGLAMAYYELSSVYEAPGEAMTKVRESAEAAIRLDPGLAEAHVILGLVAQRYDWNWKEAQAEFERALACNPKSDFARQQYATSLALTGRLKDALIQLHEAKLLNLTSKEIDTELGVLQLYLGDYVKAEKMFSQAIKAGFSPAHHYNGILLIAQDRFEEAIMEFEAALAAQTSAVDPALLGALGYAYAKAGDGARAQEILTQLENPSTNNRYVCKTAIAIVHIGLNDKDAAFACLDEAVVDRDEYLLWLKVDPFFEPLKSDPRYKELCEKVFGEPPPSASDIKASASSANGR